MTGGLAKFVPEKKMTAMTRTHLKISALWDVSFYLKFGALALGLIQFNHFSFSLNIFFIIDLI